MRKQFKRKQRYFVLKVKDAKEYLDARQLDKLVEIADTISKGREKDGIPAVECVVVESDWPEYEQTWRAIEARMMGAQLAPSIVGPVTATGYSNRFPLYAQPAPSVPDGVAEALQRLIENGAVLGPASSEDALLVARYRQRLLACAPSVPEGWKLVPIEPTEEMREVGVFAGGAYYDVVEAVYEAMLTAAPEAKP